MSSILLLPIRMYHFTTAYNSYCCLYFVAFGAIYILIYSSEIFSYSICSDTIINTQTVLC